MKPGMRMLMLDKVRQSEQYPRSEYGGGSDRRMIGYDRPENTYRDRDNDGRYHEGNRMAYGDDWRGSGGEYARMGGYGPEARRRRDDRGRYMMGGMDEDEPRGYSPQMGYPQMRGGNSYGDIYAEGTIYAPGAMNKPMGHGSSHEQYGEMDEQTARHWVRKMRNADGTPSPHWQPEQVEPLRMQHCPDCGKWEFWACMNMMYADYCTTAKKMGVDKPEFYAGMAKAFLEDEDAKGDKLMRYMKAVAE